MTEPLVSVICLCFNQGRFVTEAIESVLQQSYPNIQIIVVDDFSSDNSIVEIAAIASTNPDIEFISLQKNHGNCKAFNIAWKKAKGEYIIDFACDDIMLPDRIKKQVDFFRTLDDTYGVIYSDASYVDENGSFLYNYVENLRSKRLLNEIPQGDIYEEVIFRYFISSPTMMIRNSVLQSLNGYDESLAYEDFDFWIRSSRHYKYAFQTERLTKVRKSRRSMSTRLYEAGDAQLHSTYLICQKIKHLNRSEAEKQSLIRRVRYEIKHAVFSQNKTEAMLFFNLLRELTPFTIADRMLLIVKNLPLPLAAFRRMYQNFLAR